MKQLSLFDEAPKKVGLLHRCHLYAGDELRYTAFPSLKGMKVLRIKRGGDMVQNLTEEEYKKLKAAEGLKEVKP